MFKGLKIKKSDFLCSLGIACNFTWCILEAHSSSFASSIHQFSLWLNPRIFWLVGVIVISFCFVFFPKFIKKNDHLFRLVIPLISVVGTACFAISYSQSLVDPFILAMVGLALSGVGFPWFVARFILLMARTKTFANCVWVLVGAILIKTSGLIIISALFNESIQTFITVFLPLVTTIIFECARSAAGKEILRSRTDSVLDSASVKKHTVFGLPTLPRKVILTKGDQRSLIALLVMAGFLFAIIRRLSFLGLWIDIGSAATSIMWQLPELAAIFVFLVPSVYLTLIITQNLSYGFRFQPAIVASMAVLMFMSLDPGGHPFLQDAQSIVIHLGESLAWVMGYSIVVYVLDALDMPPFRVFGIGGLTFSLSSLFWVYFFGSSITLDGVILLTVAYIGLVATMAFSFLGSKRYSKIEETAQAMEEQIRMREFEGSPPANAAAENSIVSIITDRSDHLSKQFRLSPREAEVFCLLAQGRTRSYIQEELVLSDSTIKTHITHIYSKLGVSDRQEMMDLVLAEPINYSLE